MASAKSRVGTNKEDPYFHESDPIVRSVFGEVNFLPQRELFTTAIAVVTALAGGIPALVRVAGLFERKPAATNV